MSSDYSVASHPRALELLASVVESVCGLLPPPVAKMVAGMVQPSTQVRFTTADVVNSTYFAAGQQAVLNTVENLPSKDIGTQSSNLISMLQQVLR